MAKNSTYFILIGILLLIIGGMYLQSKINIFVITGSETMTRAAPTTVNPGQSFTLTYTASGVSGSWGSSIQDSVSGGCTFPSGSASYKTVMLSEDGNTKSITMTAPSSGSCVFSGDYKFGTSNTISLPATTVNVCVKVCIRPADKCLASSPDNCGGTCSWTVTKKTSADINCDNIIDRTELGVAINSWIAGTLTRDDLGTAIQSWSTG